MIDSCSKYMLIQDHNICRSYRWRDLNIIACDKMMGRYDLYGIPDIEVPDES